MAGVEGGMAMTQAPFPGPREAAANGAFEGESRPDWRSLRDRLGAAHALRRQLDEPCAAAPRGSFAPLAARAGGVFVQPDGACGKQGKEPVNPKALSNRKGGRANAVGTAGTSMAGG